MHANKSRGHLRHLIMDKRNVSIILRLSVLMFTLLVVSGDVEKNPGPITRQATLAVEPSSGNVALTTTKYTNEDIMNVLIDIKTDLKQVNDRFSNLNTKVNNMAAELRGEVTRLRADNANLCTRLNAMEDRLEDYESRSRRNNLLFHGINEEKGESWEMCEIKVRRFMKETLNLADADNIPITRAHRLRNGKRNPPIIANFVATTDKNKILKSSKEITRGQDSFSQRSRVTEDLTKRVRDARRSLAPLFSDALKEGLHPKIRHDKLFVGEKVYAYDRISGANICISDKEQITRPKTTGSRSILSIGSEDVGLFTS